ncbi:MAG: hypothetical protein HC875_25045 [Anaerolineales bacterium]|nr:hypothetical protein [Anaerolineales bacterium]
MFDIVRKIGQAALLVSLIGVAAACGDMARPEDIPPMTPEEAQSAPTSQPTPTPPADVPVEIKAVPTATALPVEIVEPGSPVLPTDLAVEPAAPAEGAAPASPGSDAALAAAIADLTKQSGVPSDQITVVSVEPMEWPDASLGCPQEGMMYAQVITPGYLIVLEAQGQQYEYHTDQGTNVVLCQK